MLKCASTNRPQILPFCLDFEEIISVTGPVSINDLDKTPIFFPSIDLEIKNSHVHRSQVPNSSMKWVHRRYSGTLVTVQTGQGILVSSCSCSSAPTPCCHRGVRLNVTKPLDFPRDTRNLDFLRKIFCF